MHKLCIHHLGPIESCEIEIGRLMVLTGEQASGKSTIAKAVYFFRTVKDEILAWILKGNMIPNRKTEKSDTAKRAAGCRGVLHDIFQGEENHEEAASPLWFQRMQKILLNKFIQVSGLPWDYDTHLYLMYYYDENTWIRISGPEPDNVLASDSVYMKFSRNIYEFLDRCSGYTSTTKEIGEKIKYELAGLFHDDSETVFIPAGREMITLLTNQLNYLFATMDDSQKASIDYCTRSYIERILKMKPLFENGIQGMYRSRMMTADTVFDENILKQMTDLIPEILKGKYVCTSGEERLVLGDDSYIKMNFASSGQQECIWILNILFYHVLENKKTYIILEEPEAHLYPDAQKIMTELIALFINAGNAGMVTTHSPYMLGAVNNLLYAFFLGEKDRQKVSEIIPEDMWLDAGYTCALRTEGGTTENIMDEELPMIRNETIDGISEVINADNEKLMQIHIALEDSGWMQKE